MICPIYYIHYSIILIKTIEEKRTIVRGRIDKEPDDAEDEANKA